jgi:AI-2 transport protein TqsA
MSLPTRAIYLIAATLIVIWGLKFISPIFVPVFFAFTLTLILYPVVHWLENHGLSRFLAIALLVLTLMTIFAALGATLYMSLTQFATRLPEYAQMFNARLVPLAELAVRYRIPVDPGAISSLVNGQAITAWVFAFLSGFITNTISVGFFLFTLLLMVAEADPVVQKFRQSVPSDHPFVVQFGQLARNVQKQYGIQTIANATVASLITITLLLYRIDFALLWGLLIFFLAYIPNFGIIIGTVPAALLGFIQYGPGTAFLVVLTSLSLNALMDNFVTPRFMGRGLAVPVVYVFVSFLFWTWMFGPLGAFISLPLTLIIRAFLASNPQTAFVARLLTAEKPSSKLLSATD